MKRARVVGRPDGWTGRVRDQGGYALATVIAVMGFTVLVITALMSLMFTTLKVTEVSERTSSDLRALESAVDVAVNQMRHHPERDQLNSQACDVQSPIEFVDRWPADAPVDAGDAVEIDCYGAYDFGVESSTDQVRLLSQAGYTGPITWPAWPWESSVGFVPDGLATMKPNLVHTGSEPLRIDSGVSVRNGAVALRSPADGSPAIAVAGEYQQGAPGPGANAENRCGVLSAAGPARVVDRRGAGAPECDLTDLFTAVDLEPTEPLAGIGSSTNTNPFVPLNNCPRHLVDLRPGYYDQAKVDTLNLVTDQARGSQGNCNNQSTTYHFHPGVYFIDADELVFDRPRGYFVLGAPKGWTPFLADATDNWATEVRHPDIVGLGDNWAAMNLVIGVKNSPSHRDPQAELCDTAQSGVTFVLSPRTKLTHRSGRFAMCPAFSPVAGQPPLPAIYQQTSVDTGVKVHADLDGNTPGGAQYSRSYNCNFTVAQGSKDIIEPQILHNQRLENAQTVFGITSPPSGTCRNGRTHSVWLTVKDPEALASAQVLVRGRELYPSNFITDRFTMVSVFRENGRRICTTRAQSGVAAYGEWANSVDLLTGSCLTPRPWNTNIFAGTIRITCDPRFPDQLAPQNDLGLVPSGTNRSCFQESKLTQESQLHRVRLEVTQFVTLAGSPSPFSQDVTIDEVQVVTNSTNGTFAGGDVTSDPAGGPIPGQFSSPQNVADPAVNFASPTMPPQCTGYASRLCEVLAPPGTSPNTPFVHELVIDDIDVDIPAKYLPYDIDPNISGMWAMIRMDPTHCPGEVNDRCPFPADSLLNQALGAETKIRFELTTAAGDKHCVERSGYIHTAQELAIDLRSNPVGPDCTAVIERFGDLDGASLRIRFEMPCLRNWAFAPWACWKGATSNHVFQVRPPAIRQVRLALRSDTYAGPTPTALVSVNATTADLGTSFNVAGKVWLPRTSLDVEWKGDVTEGRPLVTDELVLGALGSRITGPVTRTSDPELRYIVCCNERRADTRLVELDAWFAKDWDKEGDAGIDRLTGDACDLAENDPAKDCKPPPRFRVRVLFTDVVEDPGGGPAVYQPGHRAEVLDWQTCESGRCPITPRA